MTILVKKVFISSKPTFVYLLCPPLCGPFSIQESAAGGLSYKEKKSREGQGLCPVPSAFERRKRVRSVLGGMMKMMLLGWEQLPFFVFISCSKSLQNSFTQSTRFLHVLWISYNHKQKNI